MDSFGDEAVIATNDDAALCKYQAVNKGYYKDPFLDQFISNKARSSSVRKAPEINRGYYARSASIAYIVEQFIEENPDGQIISLGAGYDSLYWRLKSYIDSIEEKKIKKYDIRYVEVDMSVVTVHKIMAIRRHINLSKHISAITYKGEGLHSDQYHLISFDLRQVDKASLRSKLVDDCHLDLKKPTLCISECVLVYMPTQDSNSLINWFSSNFENLSMLNYEQCNMKDRFGDIMLANMIARHCDLMGVDACESLESQVERFSCNGLTYTKAWTLSNIFNNHLLPAEIERIEQIELLDEKELLEQLLQHYCIVIASHQPINYLSEDQYWFAKSL